MHRHSKTPIMVACFSLLFMQLSGVHVHADEEGYIGVPEMPFTHSHVHRDRHDVRGAHDAYHAHDTHHADDAGDGAFADGGEARDVSVIDLALSLFKMPLAILALFLLFILFPSVKAQVSFDFVYRVLSGRHTRWRPPLRAPPQSGFI